MFNRCTELLLLVSQAQELIPHSFSPKCSHKRGWVILLYYSIPPGEKSTMFPFIGQSHHYLYSFNFSRPDPKQTSDAGTLIRLETFAFASRIAYSGTPFAIGVAALASSNATTGKSRLKRRWLGPLRPQAAALFFLPFNPFQPPGFSREPEKPECGQRSSCSVPYVVDPGSAYFLSDFLRAEKGATWIRWCVA